MRLVSAVMFVVAMVLALTPASAMTFKFATTSNGLKVVVAQGDIIRGDARRLAKALERADRDDSGTKRLYLESEGGLVVEAMKMAAVLGEVGVSTIVRKGTNCFSACASVLFVSGKYRTVESGALLGIHSCYEPRTGKALTYCNAMMSAHAESVGVSGALMMTLHEAAGTDTILVFNTDDAACFGLTLKPGAKASARPPRCVRELMGQ